MNTWTKRTLGSICDEFGGHVQTGPFGSQLHQSDYSTEGIPVVMPKDLIEGTISTETIARIPIEMVQKLSRYKLNSGDIVYGRRGDIGRQAIILDSEEGWLCGTGCLSLRVNKDVLEPRFLHYYLNQDSLVDWMKSRAIGATMPNLNTDILRSTPIVYPDIKTQKHISSIIGTYDNLIKNNESITRCLEEIAQLLYEEWFVKFKFPGYEKNKMIDSGHEFGMIPDGWEVTNIQDSMMFNPGKVIDAKNRKGSKNPIYGANGIIGYTDSLTPHPPCIILGKIGSCGSLHRSYVPCWVSNNAFCVTKSKIQSESLAWQMLKRIDFRKFVGGAANPYMPLEYFGKHKVLVPEKKVQNQFEELVGKFASQSWLLLQKTALLKKTRDLLIQQLVTGKCKIK